MRSLLFVVLLAACNERPPLPGGPPPEYEPPRSYEPKGNIDKPSKEQDPIDKLLEDPAPPPESSAPPPPSAVPSAPPSASAPKQAH